MKLDLNQITISVKDVEQSIAFYEKLGLRLIVKALPKYARFECVNGTTTFSLHQSDEEVKPTTWIYFETDNVKADVEQLQASGVAFDLLPTQQSWLWEEAHCKDSDGNKIIIYHAGKNRKNPPWRIN